jgi:hypothetical protein
MQVQQDYVWVSLSEDEIKNKKKNIPYVLVHLFKQQILFRMFAIKIKLSVCILQGIKSYKLFIDSLLCRNIVHLHLFMFPLKDMIIFHH